MEKTRYLWIVTSKADPAREAEYNKWYDRHVTTIFKFPGLKQVVRNKIYRPMQNPDACPQYVVVYEFDTKEDLEAFIKSPAAGEAKREYEEEE